MVEILKQYNCSILPAAQCCCWKKWQCLGVIAEGQGCMSVWHLKYWNGTLNDVFNGTHGGSAARKKNGTGWAGGKCQTEKAFHMKCIDLGSVLCYAIF